MNNEKVNVGFVFHERTKVIRRKDKVALSTDIDVEVYEYLKQKNINFSATMRSCLEQLASKFAEVERKLALENNRKTTTPGVIPEI